MTQQWPDESDVFDGDAALRRLDELEVPLTVLNRALDAGDVAAGSADEYSPVMAAGSLRWLATATELRRGLAPLGWVPIDDRNQPRAVLQRRRIAVTVIGGDRRTGLVGYGEPRSARSHGSATSRHIDANEQNMLDIAPVELADMSAERSADLSTWVLLYFRAAERLRAELSLPAKMDERGFVVGWWERIVLPVIDFDPVESKRPRDASPDDEVPFPVLAL